MRLGFIEPHLKQYGGIRRVVELSNALVRRGHDVTIYVPSSQPLECDWLELEARVRPVSYGFSDPLDVVVFNHEPQWWLVDHFRKAELRVFYALHYGRAYNKAGSWECLRSPVDLILANSAWTADRIYEEIGTRPEVVLGGINPEHFRPVDTPTAYEVLAVGDRRWWKGTATIHEACEIAGVEPTFYRGKGVPQSEMAREYSSAEVFVVGSEFEGFGQPGLEALACGVPLVTTDNGGCREYAFHEETALIVPPRDAESMAAAILRLRDDRVLARNLVERGLEVVRERFSWEASARSFERAIAATDPEPELRSRPNVKEAEPALSIVMLQWDQMGLTQRCVDSIRCHTDVPYELIIVDNGSDWDGRSYAEQAADRFIGNRQNRGFAAGMNQGLGEARGRWVAFVNNDTVLPDGWASMLIEAADKSDVPGIVCPAFTTAGNDRTVRESPGDEVEILLPFERPPSAVVWMMQTPIARQLGGFGEEFPVASGEDLDLAFKVWTNGLDILYDQRVLVEHVGHATSESKLKDRKQLWTANRELFLDKWEEPSNEAPWLKVQDEHSQARARATAAAVAMGLRREFRARERLQQERGAGGRVEQLESRLADREARVKELKAKLADRRARVSSLEGRIAAKEARIAVLEGRVERWHHQLTNLPLRSLFLHPHRPSGRLLARIWPAVRWAIPLRARHWISSQVPRP